MATTQSDSIINLIKALLDLQADMVPVMKDSEAKTNQYTQKYASLQAIAEAVDPLLIKHQLVIVQMPDYVPGAFAVTTYDKRNDQTVTRESPVQPVLVTRLFHQSGEWISSEMPLLLVRPDPNAQGSAITYARRYAKCALLGIIQADDDGVAASQYEKPRHDNRNNQNRGNYQNQQRQGEPLRQPQTAQVKKKIELNFGAVMSHAIAHGYKIDDAKTFLSNFFQMEVGPMSKLPASELQKGLDALISARPKKQQGEPEQSGGNE